LKCVLFKYFFFFSEKKEWINEKDSEIINSLRISTTQNFCEVFEPIFPIEYPTINIIEPDNLPIISPKSTKDEYLLGGGIQFQRSRSLPTFDTSFNFYYYFPLKLILKN